MPALSSDASLAQRQATIVSQTDAAIRAKFPSARDGVAEPAEGFFDSADDAVSSVATRFNLIGIFRRRFKATVQEVLVPDLSAGLPCYRLKDAEQSVDAVHLTGRLEVDFEDETSGMELFG